MQEQFIYLLIYLYNIHSNRFKLLDVIDINNFDKTLIKCNMRPTCGRFRDCFLYRTMDLWNRLPSHIRQVTKVSILKVKLTTFLWGADTDWHD